MKKKMMIAGLLFTAFGFQGVHANEYSEKTQYLGVVNGQVVGNSVVKVTRTPTDPVLYRSDDALPVQLRVRDAEVRPASGGMAYITVKQVLPDNQEARITLKNVPGGGWAKGCTECQSAGRGCSDNGAGRTKTG